MIDEAERLSPVMDPQQQAFEIESWPFYHLARLTALYGQRMEASLKPLGIDMPRWRVLAILDKRGTCTITQLTGEAVSRMSTMAKIIQRMMAEELVIATKSADDQRTTEVEIAPRGREILVQVQDKVGRIGRDAFHDVSKSELQTLIRTTRKIHTNLSP